MLHSNHDLLAGDVAELAILWGRDEISNSSLLPRHLLVLDVVEPMSRTTWTAVEVKCSDQVISTFSEGRPVQATCSGKPKKHICLESLNRIRVAFPLCQVRHHLHALRFRFPVQRLVWSGTRMQRSSSFQRSAMAPSGDKSPHEKIRPRAITQKQRGHEKVRVDSERPANEMQTSGSRKKWRAKKKKLVKMQYIQCAK